MFYVLNLDDRFVVSKHFTAEAAMKAIDKRLAKIKKRHGKNSYQNLYVAQMCRRYRTGDYYDNCDIIRPFVLASEDD